MHSAPRPINLDHAATTALDPRVLEAMLPSLRSSCGNPSSMHGFGREASAAVRAARTTVADILGAKPSEIIFTGGGTESDNLALRGTVTGNRSGGGHIITLPVEHHAITHTCEDLVRRFGCKVTYVPVDRFGMVNPEDVARAITHDTSLISIMYANNEVGTIEPIEEIGRIARARGIPFHTDAVQAAGTLPLNVNRLGVDLLSLAGHKFYGPKGVGVLYVREGTAVAPVQTGGSQELGLRAGTENVPGIVGLAAALTLAHEHAASECQRLAALRDLLIAGILAAIPRSQLTGHATQRLANSASFVFAGLDSGDLVRELNDAGVAASGGSACASCIPSPSHVLTAMGYGRDLARGSLRLTLGAENTEEDVRYVLKVLPQMVARLRTGATGKLQPNSPLGVLASEATSAPEPGRLLEISHERQIRVGSGLQGGELEGFGPGGVIASGCSHGLSSSLVYALGEVGYDFGTDTRQASFLLQAAKDVREPQHMLEHLADNPSSATGIIWTLNIEGVPIYAIQPSGPYAADGYGRLRNFLASQLAQEAERIAVPGIIGGSVRLLNRQWVPVIIPELRGMTPWSAKALIQSVLGKSPAKKQDRMSYEQEAADISNFLERIYYEMRNPGVTPQERAINYAATHAAQVGRVFRETVKAGLKLDAITAERTPLCRPGSDCWDVKLTFFHPSKRLEEARLVYRLTVDVSDLVPVTMGKARQWHIY